MAINRYIQYTDIFTAEGVYPTCGIRNFLLLFDNLEPGPNPLEAISSTQGVIKLFQTTLFYVMKGEATFEINNDMVTVRENQVLTTMPDSSFRFERASSDIKYFMLVVYPSVNSLTFHDIGVNVSGPDFVKVYRVGNATEEIMDYNLTMYKALKDDIMRPNYEYKPNYLRAIMNVIYVQNMNLNNVKINNTGDSNSRQYDVYCKFLALLNKHADQERAVQYYAKQLGISSKYLSFVCIAYSKKNASTWIDETVIAKAKVLMTVHGYSFYDISQMLRFQTVSSFSRFFKRVTKQTPKEYLKSTLKK